MELPLVVGVDGSDSSPGGHWGVSVRLQNGQLRIGVPDSEESPIRVVLADRAVTVAPGEACRLTLPGN
jgi:hypothetical protein